MGITMTVVAISGTPGTGKTEVARLVGKRLSWPVYELNKLAHERKLYSGYDEERETHVVDIGKIQKALDNIEAQNMIIEAHYAHDMKCDIVIILRASPDEIRKRGREKGWSGKKTEENVLSEIMDVCHQEALGSGKKVFEVDTTGKKPEKAAEEVAGIIRKVEDLKGKPKE